jgi:EpsI family protein
MMVLLLIAALAIAFSPTIRTLQEAWADTQGLTYTHGYLVAAISIWLLIRSSKTLDGSEGADWRMAALLALLSVCWLLFLRAGIELLHQVLLPVMAIAAACAAFGIRNGGRLSLGFAYLYFAIPIWSAGNAILQAITVKAVQAMLQVTAVPAHVTGNLVYIPAGAFEIAGGCSGLHYFIVAIAIAALFGEIHRDSLRVRAQQLILAALLAMGSNWLRVYVIILAGHLTDMQHYLVKVDHYYFGWFLFVITMAAFFWIAGRMPAQDGAPAERRQGEARSPWVKGMLIAIVAAAIGPVLGVLSPVGDAVASPARLPELAGGWDGPIPASEGWRPIYPHADRSELVEYRRGGRVATVFIAQYLQQRQGKELVGFDNTLLGRANAEASRRRVHTNRGEAVVLESGSGAGKSLVAFYYLIGEERAASDLSAQLAYAAASFRGPVLSRIVAVRVQCGSECAVALSDATALLDEIDTVLAASHRQ